MPLFLWKSILGIVFFAAALGAALSMLILMGRQNHKVKPKHLRRTHKIFGFVFFFLLLVISFKCIQYVAGVGDQMPLRAVSHSVLALLLFIIFAVKILIVRFFKQFLKYIPVFGMTVFCLAFVVTATSAGFYLLRSSHSPAETAEVSFPSTSPSKGSAEKGKILFTNKCSFCHYADREEDKMGPGLKSLLKKDKLPYSGRPATVENVKTQLLHPVLTMPAFKDLKDKELADLIAYLEFI
jgi:cytochrome c2